MKMAIVITTVVTVAYALCLLVANNLPVERVLFVYRVDLSKWLQFPLPFEVSCWWSLLLFPIAIMVIAYAASCNLIVGKEPSHPGFPGDAQFKYRARLALYFVTNISNIVAFIFVVVCVMLFSLSFLKDEMGGLLSSLISGFYVWIICYVIFGSAMEFMKALLWESCEHSEGYTKNEETFTKKYQVSVVAFAKLGIIKTFPLLFGLTCGYLLRGAINKIVGLFDSEGEPFAG